MGEANRRRQLAARHHEMLQPWLQRYIRAIKTLALADKDNVELLIDAGLFSSILAIMTDIEVLLLSQNLEPGKLGYSILPQIFRSVTEAAEQGPVWLFRNGNGQVERSMSPPFTFESGPDNLSGISGMSISLDGGQRWIYTSMRLIGWNKLEQLDPEAYIFSEWATRRLIRNLNNSEFVRGRRDNPTTLLKVINDAFRKLLDSAEREEDLQRFLHENPILIYPEHLSVLPKHKLGKEFVTDFVFINSGHMGKEHVFVEIERPSKLIFTKADVFSSDFTQALDQLTNWDIWIRENLAYIKNDFPELGEAVLHLVYGRSAELSRERRRKIRSHFTRLGIRFSTFDDLADKLATVLSRIENISELPEDVLTAAS